MLVLPPPLLSYLSDAPGFGGQRAGPCIAALGCSIGLPAVSRIGSPRPGTTLRPSFLFIYSPPRFPSHLGPCLQTNLAPQNSRLCGGRRICGGLVTPPTPPSPHCGVCGRTEGAARPLAQVDSPHVGMSPPAHLRSPENNRNTNSRHKLTGRLASMLVSTVCAGWIAGRAVSYAHCRRSAPSLIASSRM